MESLEDAICDEMDTYLQQANGISAEDLTKVAMGEVHRIMWPKLDLCILALMNEHQTGRLPIITEMLIELRDQVSPKE